MFKIIKADERMAQPSKVNLIILGPSGVGKTTLARTLDPATTLFLDLEAGMLAVQDWPGDSIDVRASAEAIGVTPWEFARALACVIGGPDPSDLDGPYSRMAYDTYIQKIDPKLFEKYETVFVDSITVAGRHSFEWSKRQPQAMSEKTGKPDTRGAYGLHGQEMVRWLTQLQHIRTKNIIVVGILDRTVDELKRVSYDAQIEGSKAGREMGGIFDEVLTLCTFVQEGDMVAAAWPTEQTNKIKFRAFVCTNDNAFGLPAKDRSGRLDMLEPPDLGRLIQKIRTGARRDALVTAMASPAPAAS
jgi:hypothetical protein